MIETWFLVFLIIYIRNKFIHNLEKNNIYIYQKYNIKNIFYHWSIIPPLLTLLFYIYLEYSMFVGLYYFIPYQHTIKTIILLSYFPMIIIYKLYNNDNKKYKDNELSKIITSPLFKAGFSLWLGSKLNEIVMARNNGYMPVYPSNSFWTGYFKPEFIQDGIHMLGNAYTKLIPLSDWLDFGVYIISPGDILVRLFILIILYYSVKNSNKIIK